MKGKAKAKAIIKLSLSPDEAAWLRDFLWNEELQGRVIDTEYRREFLEIIDEALEDAKVLESK